MLTKARLSCPGWDGPEPWPQLRLMQRPFALQALMKLNEAEVLRNSLEKKANVIARFEEATFFSLKGEVCWRMGHVKLAKKMLREALSLLGRQFPRTSTGAFVKSRVEKLPCATYVARRASSLPQEARPSH
ncbi:adenylate cyclase type 10-like [Morphnus guianensis]